MHSMPFYREYLIHKIHCGLVCSKSSDRKCIQGTRMFFCKPHSTTRATEHLLITHPLENALALYCANHCAHGIGHQKHFKHPLVIFTKNFSFSHTTQKLLETEVANKEACSNIQRPLITFRKPLFG